MWESFQKQQSDLTLLIKEKERLQRRLASLNTAVVEQGHKRNELERLLAKEQKEAEKMDGFSFSNMVRKWNGTFHDARDREQAEAAAVELKWHEAVKMVRDLEMEAERVRKELADDRFQDLNGKWEFLMVHKENWLLENSPDNKVIIEELYDRKTAVQSMLREIDEARDAGNTASRLLSTAIGQLEDARSYSTWDTFLGGGIFVTAMKHSAIDESEDTIHKAQMALHRFRTEVKDVQAMEASSFIVERGEFIKMADYFFDDIFSEWTIHSRITKSQENLESTVSDVNKVMRSLASKKHVLEAELNEIEAARKELVEA